VNAARLFDGQSSAALLGAGNADVNPLVVLILAGAATCVLCVLLIAIRTRKKKAIRRASLDEDSIKGQLYNEDGITPFGAGGRSFSWSGLGETMSDVSKAITSPRWSRRSSGSHAGEASEERSRRSSFDEIVDAAMRRSGVSESTIDAQTYEGEAPSSKSGDAKHYESAEDEDNDSMAAMEQVEGAKLDLLRFQQRERISARDKIERARTSLPPGSPPGAESGAKATVPSLSVTFDAAAAEESSMITSASALVGPFDAPSGPDPSSRRLSVPGELALITRNSRYSEIDVEVSIELEPEESEPEMEPEESELATPSRPSLRL